MVLDIFVGVRPEIIKLWPIIEELRNNNTRFRIVHTGQHYDWELSKQILEELRIGDPDIHLENFTKNNDKSSISNIIERTTNYLMKSNTKAALILGDSNSSLGVGLAAKRMGIELFYVESGCRSFDWTMMEEMNRVILSDCADINFAPTLQTEKNLRNENVRGEIHLTGHPIVKAISDIEKELTDIKNINGIDIKNKNKIVTVTTHRPENVDSKDNLKNILKTISELKYQVVLPLHPRTKKRIEEFELTKLIDDSEIIVTEPLSYISMLKLIKHSEFVITDSGGLQQESYLLQIPTVTIRKSTEWVETVQAGVNKLINPKETKLNEELETMGKELNSIKKKFRNNKNIFGTIEAPKKIREIIEKRIVKN